MKRFFTFLMFFKISFLYLLLNGFLEKQIKAQNIPVNVNVNNFVTEDMQTMMV